MESGRSPPPEILHQRQLTISHALGINLLGPLGPIELQGFGASSRRAFLPSACGPLLGAETGVSREAGRIGPVGLGLTFQNPLQFGDSAPEAGNLLGLLSDDLLLT